MKRRAILLSLLAASHVLAGDLPPLKLARRENWLVIQGNHLPGGEIKINYLEAYCRPGSTEADWVKQTVIKHTNEMIAQDAGGQSLQLRDTLADGVIVDHVITAKSDEIEFQITARNPSAVRSEAHWAQPCIRLAEFTGFDPAGKNLDDYLPKAFIFLDGKLKRMSEIKPWSKEARYTPGQVWCPKSVPRTDVNPRPLSPLVPSCGLIGCFSGDENLVFAVAFEPYQELFQGVARCVHSDFRIGGLEPGETKKIRGKIYILKNDPETLLKRYEKDFPEHGHVKK